MPAGTPFFSGCSGGGSGVIDEYITMLPTAATWHQNGQAAGYAEEPTTAVTWLSGVHQGVGGYMVNLHGAPHYYNAFAQQSDDLIVWVASPFTGYPDRLTLWPPPVDTATLEPVTIGGFSTCGYSIYGYPGSEGSSGGGGLLVYPFAIEFLRSDLPRGTVGVLYGPTFGFFGQGLYFRLIDEEYASGYAGTTVLTYTATGLPSGLSIFGGNILLGVPDVGTEGTHLITLRATDSGGYYHEQVFGLAIGPAQTYDADFPSPDPTPDGSTDVPPSAPSGSGPSGSAQDEVAGGPGFSVAPAFNPAGAGVHGQDAPLVVGTGWQVQRFDARLRREGKI